jgi:hypothetical protein
MNPRYRRLVLPALLVALVLVVVIASLAKKSDAAPADPPVAAVEPVSTLTDPRISESSGLAVSRAHPGLLYTLNDSGHAPVVYVIEAATGRTVGTTTVDARWQDTEAIGLDGNGLLWVADIGDNSVSRDQVSLYALPEPGPGTHEVTAREYPLAYAGGSFDAETLLVDPTSDAKWIVTKRADGGQVFPLTGLRPGRLSVLQPLAGRLASFATDGSVTPDGKYAVVRTGTQAVVYDLDTWAVRGVTRLPAERQGEGLTLEPSGTSYLIDSEGANTPLLRVSLSVDAVSAAPPELDPSAAAPWPGLPWLAGGVMLAVAGVGIWVIGRRSVR